MTFEEGHYKWSIFWAPKQNIMKLVLNGKRQGISKTHMNSNVTERLYILKKSYSNRRGVVNKESFGSQFQAVT